MDIRVSGHQMDTGEALNTHVTDRLSAIADKYFSRAIRAQATFSKAPHDQFACDIVAHIMQGLVLKGRGDAHNAHAAFEQAADRVEKQLRRYMRRIKARSGNLDMASAAVLIEDNAGYVVFEPPAEAEDDIGDAPAIIAETMVDIPTASVSDAVMMLDLRNTNALMFMNSRTGVFNMVYRRQDATIGWVEPR